MDIVNLLIHLLSGIAGGNLTGSLARSVDLGPLGNSIAGLVGGGIGGQLLTALLGLAAVRAGVVDIPTFIGHVLSGGLSGGILAAIVGMIRAAMAR